MTVKERIRDVLRREPMITREAADAARIDYRLCTQMILEMKDELTIVGRKPNHRNQPCYIWALRAKTV
jgi:hypothetical protein